MVDELRRRATSSPSSELVELPQRAIGDVVRVIEHADGFDGTIGDPARERLELHATACDSAVADPVRLAGWMVRFWFVDQDLFEVDPVRYQGALGQEGVGAYRQAAAARASTRARSPSGTPASGWPVSPSRTTATTAPFADLRFVG